MAIPAEIKLLPPWTVLGVDRAQALELELTRELSPNHALEGRKVTALAARNDCDEVLFEIEDGAAKLALVHMTWSKEVNSKWPRTILFDNWEEWAQNVKLPNHQEHISGE